MAKNKHFQWLARQWRGHTWYIVMLLVFTVISNVVSIAYPLVFRKLIDLLSSILASPADHPDPLGQINRLIMVMLAIGIGQLIAGFYPLLRGAMNSRFEHVIRMRYFKHIQDKDYAFYQHFRTGDLVTRLNDGLPSFILCSGIFRSLDSILILLFGIIVMLKVNALLTMLSLAPIPFIMTAIFITFGKLERISRKNMEAISNINNQLELSFSGIRIIKAFVSEHKYNRFFDSALDTRFKTELSLVKLTSIQQLVFHYIDYFAQVGVIMFGGWMAVQGTISIGTFFLFYTYLAILVVPVFTLPTLLVEAKQAFVSIDRLEEMKDYPLQHIANNGTRAVETLHSLSFDNVSFKYPEKEKPVIRNCSFTIANGEKLLVLGSTGAGKTTLANLITRILHPGEGRILVNGIPLNELDTAQWRNLLGFVPQDAMLFSGSINDNIRFADEINDPLEYRQSIQTAQLSSELDTFPDRDLTEIGNKGQTVSGGQKQRITIARALVKKPSFLILDDITASLDAENEEKLWQELTMHYADLTCLVVSQRLSTLRYVDSVLFIACNGHCHKGRHEELLAAVPEYRTFITEDIKS